MREQALRDQYREVLRFVRRRVRSYETAEDVTQEVFADATSALARSAEAAPPTLAWLYTVAGRRIVDEARRRRTRRATVPLELVEDPAAPATYGNGVERALRAGLASMPEGQRFVVTGRLLRGRSFAELARELDASEEACRMRFMRGLQHLRSVFEEEGLRP
ncbi:MAG TPA: RNA polymerase sigma factor [Gaiellaceae bacterium]|nr:RNA polymerase sigma factor [Gaiellaceae bacterium]